MSPENGSLAGRRQKLRSPAVVPTQGPQQGRPTPRFAALPVRLCQHLGRSHSALCPRLSQGDHARVCVVSVAPRVRM